MELSLYNALRAGLQTPGGRAEVALPVELCFKRELNTNFTAGGATVGTHVSPILEALRPHSVALLLGSQLLTLRSDERIGRVEGGYAAQWLSETGELSESTATFAATNLTPKRVAAIFRISTQLLTQSGQQVEAALQRDLAAAIGYQLDVAAFVGVGGVEPLGLLNRTDIEEAVTFGGSTQLIDLCEFEQDLADQFGEQPGQTSFVTSTGTRSKWRRTLRDSVAGGGWLWTDDDRVIGKRALATPVIGNDDSRVLYGSFADLAIGMWGNINFQLDRYTRKKNGQVEIMAELLVDVGPMRPDSFIRSTDAGNQ